MVGGDANHGQIFFSTALYGVVVIEVLGWLAGTPTMDKMIHDPTGIYEKYQMKKNQFLL